ncbi:XPG N-terminal domain-containing protein, partial [Toxoplasma gondii GAB2-2007-GAL-DOM2]
GQLECLRDFDQTMFTAMCVLGGCDYTHDVHINGLGISTACRFVHKLGKLEAVIQYLFKDEKWRKKLTLPQEVVLRGHKMAMVAFTHHRVFDMNSGLVVSASSLLPHRSSLSASLSSVSPVVGRRHASSCAQTSADRGTPEDRLTREEKSAGEKENHRPEGVAESSEKKAAETELAEQAEETERRGDKKPERRDSRKFSEGACDLDRDDSDGEVGERGRSQIH